MPQESLYDVLRHVAVDHPCPNGVTEAMRMNPEQHTTCVAHAVAMREFIDCVPVEVRRHGTAPPVHKEPGRASSPTIAHHALLLLNNCRQLAGDGDLELLTHLGLLVPQEVIALLVSGEAILSQDACFADPHSALFKHKRHA